MKRRVTAATDASILAKLSSYIIEYVDGELYHAGYDVTGEGVLPGLKLTATCREAESEFMPTLTLEVRESREGVFDIMPTLTFPTLSQDDMECYDSIHYWLGKWENIGSYISSLNCKEWEVSSYDEEDFE